MSLFPLFARLYHSSIMYHIPLGCQKLTDSYHSVFSLDVYNDRVFFLNLQVSILHIHIPPKKKKISQHQTLLPPVLSTGMSQSGTFEAWFNAFPSVALETLAIENQNCGICRVDYSPFSVNRHPEDPVEQPVRLPCGHVFGQICLKEWLSPPPQGFDKKKCPTCRFRLAEREERLPYLQWLERLDYANVGDRNFVLGWTLASTLNERDARYQFYSRVEQERQNEIEGVGLRRRILEHQQRGMELCTRLLREIETGMPREQEEQLRSEISQTMRDALELVVREAALTRYDAFFVEGDDGQELVDGIRRIIDTPAQEHHDY